MIAILPFLCCILIHQSWALSIARFDIEHLWETYKQDYQIYVPANKEEQRKRIFLKNYQAIQEFNSQHSDLVLGINKYAHLESHEMPHGLKISAKRSVSKNAISVKDLPVRNHVDWRKEGVVTHVKDQGYCGSCYAFSAIGAIESSFSIKTGKKIELSEQQIVDCSYEEGNDGCNGGYMTDVFDYAMEIGIVRPKNYPYKATNGTCLIDRHHASQHHHLLSYAALPPYSEIDVVRALSFVGPVSIAIDANHYEFAYYKSGVLRIPTCDPDNLDHAVLAVGYSIGNSSSYLIVKNSWGTNWGMDGYFKLALFENNMCGLATNASYPIPYIDGEMPPSP